MSWNADHTNPPGGLDNYYRNNVTGGPGSFVMVAENFKSFGQAILNKLIAEIAANRVSRGMPGWVRRCEFMELARSKGFERPRSRRVTARVQKDQTASIRSSAM